MGISPAQWIVKTRRAEVDESLREAKRLTQQAASRTGSACAGCIDLTLAVNILIGLVEGHRHTVVSDNCSTAGQALTGPMQAREDRNA